MKKPNFVQRAVFGDRKTDAAEIPRRGTGLFWFVLQNHYLKLILLNLLFLVLCIPIVTIPASYSGLIGVIMKWARREPDVELFKTFFDEFREHFFGKLGFWFISTVAPFSIAAYLYAFTRNAVVFYAVFSVVGIAVFTVQSYFFAQLSMLKLSIGAAVKNSFILLGVEWKCSLRIFATGGLLLILCVAFTTYMIPFAVICVFSLIALSVCSEAADVIAKRLAS